MQRNNRRATRNNITFSRAFEQVERRQMLSAESAAIDGVGNNEDNPEWGSTDEELLRLTPSNMQTEFPHPLERTCRVLAKLATLWRRSQNITAFLDGSVVYGSDQERADSLRTFSGGLLQTSEGDLLPFNVDGLENAGGTFESLFLAGDVRANENVALTSISSKVCEPATATGTRTCFPVANFEH